MSFSEEIRRYLDEHVDEMVADAMRLMRIDSARGAATAGRPYGAGPAQALDLASEMMAECGLLVGRVGDVVVTGDLNGLERQLDILAHLDVVPGGTDWTVCEPFEPVVRDGRLYGRGSADDKGPAVAALYAMRAVKEAQVPLKRNVRLILGSDEECGSSDIAEYYAREAEAPMTFSPDAEWPLVNTEKGRLHCTLSSSWSESLALPRVLSINGGSKANVVPGRASARVRGFSVEELFRLAGRLEMPGVSFTFTAEDAGPMDAAGTASLDGSTVSLEGVVRIDALGISCHASLPEKGSNALTGLIGLLSTLPCAPSDGFSRLQAIHALFPHGDVDGTAAGICMQDEISGSLTAAFSILEMSPTSLSAEVDSRVPIVGTEAFLRSTLEGRLTAHGLSIAGWHFNPPHHVSADSHFVRTLLDCYHELSGKDGGPMAIGGGTYVHNLKSGVAFGCADLDVDNRMHGPDEFMDVSQMLMSAKIFAEAIVRLCGE